MYEKIIFSISHSACLIVKGMMTKMMMVMMAVMLIMINYDSGSQKRIAILIKPMSVRLSGTGRILVQTSIF